MSLREKHDRQESTKAREQSLQRTRGGRASGRRGPLGRQIERLCETTAQFTAVGFYGRSEVCTVALQTGGLHFCRIFTLRIFSLSLSLDPRRTWFDALDEEQASVLIFVFILARCPFWAVFFLLFWRIFSSKVGGAT
jgi:hypothetical protein